MLRGNAILVQMIKKEKKKKEEEEIKWSLYMLCLYLFKL